MCWACVRRGGRQGCKRGRGGAGVPAVAGGLAGRSGLGGEARSCVKACWQCLVVLWRAGLPSAKSVRVPRMSKYVGCSGKTGVGQLRMWV